MPGHAFTPDLVERLADIPSVIAYKDELGDVRAFAEIVDSVGERLVYVNGRAEPVSAYYAAAGATVVASAIGNFDPQLAISASIAAREHDFEEAACDSCTEGDAVVQASRTSRGSLISVSKASMNRVGLAGGVVRPPLCWTSTASLTMNSFSCSMVLHYTSVR